MKRLLLFTHFSVVLLPGCGNSPGTTSTGATQAPIPSTNPTPSAISVRPATASVHTNGVLQFTATVSPGGANQAVTWGVFGIGCSGVSCGTIDGTGTYTAPATAANPLNVTVTATSVDPTKTGSASVTIASTAIAQSEGTFWAVGEMVMPRNFHTATLLRDGTVLLAGGFNGLNDSTTASAELYDPGTGTFKPTGHMTTPRRSHSATLLAGGRVLIAGGCNPGGCLASAELYDPQTGSFTATGNMIADQLGQTATLLANGKVLIAGGERGAPPLPTAAGPELYDPATGTFSTAGNYAGNDTLYPSAGGPIWPQANLLRDGRVLLTGDNPAELYDPVTGLFSITTAMSANVFPYGMYWHTASLLTNGKVLIAGGTDEFSRFASAELYDPATGTFAPTGNMTQGRDLHTATPLPDGTVLIAGGGDGWSGSSTFTSAELYNPGTGTFSATANMITSRSGHTATLLNDGTVLIAGGDQYWPFRILPSAELYSPSIGH